MCTATCRTATWDRCRCECNKANHGVYVVVPLFDECGASRTHARAPRARCGEAVVSCPTTPSGTWADAPLVGIDPNEVGSWLEEHPTCREQVAALVEAARSADPSPGSHGTHSTHVTCTILVSVLIVLEQIEALRDRIVGSITTAVAMRTLALVKEASPRRTPLTVLAERVLATAIRRVVDLVVDGFLPGALLMDPVTLQNLRLATVLTCPDPDAHREVRQHCVAKLAVAIVEGDVTA